MSRRGEKALFSGYDTHATAPFALTVDLVIFTLREGALCVLLVQRAGHPYRDFWALPGGHVGHGRESVEQAAVRELNQETGLDWAAVDGHLEQLRTYSDPRRDPRIAAGLHVASVAYMALAPGLPEAVAGSGAAAARWWPMAALDLQAQREAWVSEAAYTGEGPTLGDDHALILADALERTRSKLEYTTLAAQFVEEPFSLNDLWRVYTAVWGSAPDLANFRRKVLGTDGFVVAVAKSDAPASDQGGRPPLLYRRGTAAVLHPAMLRTG